MKIKIDMDRCEEAMARCKQWEREHTNGYVIQDMIQFIFPELRETEDERTRKEMINYFHGCIQRNKKSGFRVEQIKNWIAYLEKQKKQPKKELGKYLEEENLAYRLNWVMQDYCKAGEDDKEKEHRFKCYQLFWDALEDTEFFEQKEQKPFVLRDTGCSKRGTKMPEYCLDVKPEGWSEEEENIINEVASILINDENRADNKVEEERLAYLAEKIQSLRPSWKPSAEQMDILDKVYHYLWADRHATADMQDGLGDFIDELKTKVI